MSVISGVTTAAPQQIQHQQPPRAPVPETNAVQANPPVAGKDADGDRDSKVGNHINTYA